MISARKLWHIPVSMGVACFICAPLLAQEPGANQSPYNFDVVAKTGEAGITDIFSGVSINDKGYFAFAGQTQGGSSLFFGGGQKPVRAVTYASQFRFFSGILQIDDASNIVSQEFNRVGSSFYNYVRRWSADASGNWKGDIIAHTDPLANRLPPYTPMFGVPNINPPPAINPQVSMNAGYFVFAGLSGPSNNTPTLATISFSTPYYTTAYTSLPVYPKVAVNGSIVLRGSQSTSPILLYDYQLQPFGGTHLADTSRFTRIGQRPGISDNGQIAVFYGDKNDVGSDLPGGIQPGPGIFAVDLRPGKNFALTRVAGVGNWIQSFSADDPIGISNNGTVVFIGTDATGNKAIFRGQVKYTATGSTFKEPIEVVMKGDKLDDQLGTINDVGFNDPVNNREAGPDIAFWASCANGKAIVRARPKVTPLVFVPGIGGTNLQEAGYSFLTFTHGLIPTVSKNIWPDGVLFTPPITLPAPPPILPLTRLTLDPFKNPNESTFPVFATDTTRDAVTKPIYVNLLEFLETEGGYREYRVNDDPRRRTRAGFDMSQKGATLFIFGYDWRKSIVENAKLLREYVLAIQQMYPGAKVDIIGHSTGCLLSRRYILDNPDDHSVRKMVALAAPWLGAPRAIQASETGLFFNPSGRLENIKEDGPPEVLDYLYSDTFKTLLEFWPGMHGLLPSGKYFANAPFSPFGEFNWDANGDEVYTSNYTYAQMLRLLDARHPRPQPTAGLTAELLHARPGQDDWRDPMIKTGVKYYSVFAVQSRQRTLARLDSFERIGLGKTPYDGIVREELLKQVFRFGDGTVPVLSSARKPVILNHGSRDGVPDGSNIGTPSENLNGSETVQVAGFSPIALREDGITYTPVPDDDAMVEHNGLNSLPQVHKKVLSFLRDEQSSGNGPKIKSIGVPRVLEAPPSSYYLSFQGTGFVSVTDDQGRTNTKYNDEVAKHVPDVDYLPTGARSTDIIIPMGKAFTFTFQPGEQPFAIEVLKGPNNTNPTDATRYLDVVVPASVNVQLSVSAQGSEELRYDADSNGTFETIIKSTISVSGAAALDITAPDIQFNWTPMGRDTLVNISAADLHGVRELFFSLDRTHVQPYTGALRVNPVQTPVVYAVATDSVGNRTGLIAFHLVERATDITAQLKIERSGFRFDRTTGHFVQAVTVQNTGTSAIAGPLSLVLDDLSGNATLTNKSGNTLSVAPLGSPYITLNTNGGLNAGETAAFTLEFTRSGAGGISYNTRVLAGSGSR